MATVWFWWLVAVSQTPLASRPTVADDQLGNANPPPIQPFDDSASRLASAGLDLDRAHQAVDEARANVSAAQQRWDEWLSTRALREQTAAQSASRSEPGPAFVANPQYTEMAANLQRLTSQREELLQRLTLEHPAVQDLTARIEVANQQLARVPELISSGAGDVNPAPRSGSNANGPILAEELAANTPALDPQDPIGSAGLEPAEADVRQAWDAAQDDLQQRLAEEQRGLTKYEELRRQVAAAAADNRARRLDWIATKERSPSAAGSWPTWIGLALLGIAELIALRLALKLLEAENAVPLLSVAQVAALLPVPVLAAFPANGSPRPAPPEPGSVSGLTLWILACEGTLAVLLFLMTALTIRNLGFPADLLRHPIESMAQGLHDLHS